MLELSVLYLLKKQKMSLYSLNKSLNEKFPYLHSTSMGSIHPVIKKLEKQKFVSQKVSYTKGGLKKSLIVITKEGENFFEELMLEDLNCAANQLDLIISLKVSFSELLDEEYQKLLFTKIIKKLQQRNIDFKNLIKKQKLSNFQKNHLEFLTEQSEHYANWLQKRL